MKVKAEINHGILFLSECHTSVLKNRLYIAYVYTLVYVCARETDRDKEKEKKQRAKNETSAAEPTLPGGGRQLGQHTSPLPFHGLSGNPDSLVCLRCTNFKCKIL